MKRFIVYIICYLLLSAPAVSMAATYYIEDKGSAAGNTTDEGATAWSAAQNIATPSSLKTAANRAVAGDHIYLRAGTYQLGTTPDSTVEHYWPSVVEPVNSGTEASRITYENYNDEVVVLTADRPSGTTSPAAPFSPFRVDYTTVKGIHFKGENGAYMVSVYVGNFSNSEANFKVGCEIAYCDIDGSGSQLGDGGPNYAGIDFRGNNGAYIHHNTVYDYYAIGGSNHNTNAVKGYWNANCVIENNDVFNSAAGFYDKSMGHGMIYRNNWVHDVLQAFIYDDSSYDENDDNSFINNLVKADKGWQIVGSGNTSTGWLFRNNTVILTGAPVGDGGGFFFSSKSHSIDGIYDNIVVGTFNTQESGFINLQEPSGLTIDLLYSNYNCFYTTGTWRIRTVRNNSTYVRYQSLSGAATPIWDESGELYGGGNPDLNSITDAPGFVNLSGSQITDFALDVGSPCLGTGRYGGNIGADVSLVGTGGTPAADTTPPSVSNQSPVDQLTNVSKSTNISANISDYGSGVDQATIVMTVEGSPVTPAITGSSVNYTVSYDPPSDFAYEQVVNVTLDADDLAGNSMTQAAWSFTVESQPALTCADLAALCVSEAECSGNWPSYNWCGSSCQQAACSTAYRGSGVQQSIYGSGLQQSTYGAR